MRGTVVIVCVSLGWMGASLCGCASQPKSNVKRLNEKMVAEQELIADGARQHFHCGEYAESIELLQPLCAERTTSQPLYLCELGISYLANNENDKAREVLLEAYNSMESFLDTASEKKAVTLWGAEAEKVYKGEPYEQATLSLIMGLLLLDQGDVDNALACFKNGQFADSDVEKEQFQSDYGLLQLLEAKCYKMREEETQYQQFMKKSVESFTKTHPHTQWQFADILSDPNATQEYPIEQGRLHAYEAYNQPLFAPYNTFLLLWTGKAPALQRTGEYGEDRVIVKNISSETHLEVKIDDAQWYDVIRGYANISFQATTRGGREMDNVLAGQASFKKTTHNIGNTFFDAADDVSSPYAALFLIGMGAISHGIGASTRVQSDVRCWKMLPDEFVVVPLRLEPGTHKIQVDCYDKFFQKSRSVTREIVVDDRAFQFSNMIIPFTAPEELPQADLASPGSDGQS